jgi:replicative superfamily II helicase
MDNNIYNRLSKDAIEEGYLNELLFKLVEINHHQILKELEVDSLTNNEFFHLLRFADIMSCSDKSEFRNHSLQIISLMYEKYKNDEKYNMAALAIFSKLGSFFSIDKFLISNSKFKLPIERDIEANIKKNIQIVPFNKDYIFTDNQFELYKKISNSKAFSFSAPTSMGKSFILKSFLYKVMQNNPPENIIIMVPTRALISQFFIDIKSELHDIIELKNYKVLTNSNIVEDEESEHKYILVLTPERILSYVSSLDNPSIGFLFVDEAHKIASQKDSRSVTSYLAIEKLLKKNPNLNLYFSSPNVSNPNVFLDMYGKGNIKSYKQIKETSVNQNLFYIDLIEKYSIFFINNSPSEKQQLKIFEKVNVLNDFLFEIVLSDNNLIYCNGKGKTIEKAKSFYEFLSVNKKYKPDLSEKLRKKLNISISQIKSHIHSDYYLVDFLEYGIAYHFGNIPQIVRNIIEELFREGAIKYLFCTSTLLEGVNLPAKNVLILNNKKSRSIFEPIDFWNLAGRAGRFGMELSGNIFCIKEEENNWENKEELLIKSDIELKPTVNKKIDSNIQKIEKVLLEKDISGTEEEKYILKYIANMICIDTFDLEGTYKSPIIEQLIKNNKDKIIEYAKNKINKVDIPSVILQSNQSIDIFIQNKVFNTLKFKMNQRITIKLPNTITYDTAKTILNNIFNLYEWEKNEKLNIKSIDYFALLVTQWVNGTSLNQIINDSINWHLDNKKEIYINRQNDGLFDKNNLTHVNELINQIIDNIERKLRFVFEKYFTHYNSILIELYGEKNSGVNWAQFLEYGTQNNLVIILQNLGLSRHTANFIYKNYKKALILDNDGNFKKIDKSYLLKNINKNSIEFEEIQNIL